MSLQSRILHLPASGPSDTSPLSADVYAIRGETAWWIFDVGACDEAADFVNNLPCEIPAGELKEAAAASPSCENVAPSSAAQPLKKNIVISHFHRDHAFNLSRVHFDHLYVGRETYRHCDATIQNRRDVTIVESPLQFEDCVDGESVKISIEPIPSSHAKGSLILTIRDATDPRECASAGLRQTCGECRDATDPQQTCDASDSKTTCDAADPTNISLAKNVGLSIVFLGDSTYPTVGHGKPDSYNVQLLFQQIQFLRACEARNFCMSHRRFIPREKESILLVLENYYAQRQPNKNLIEITR